MPELRVRAGVLTGNAAVELGSEGEGMVLGDTVNTASRLQSIAAPGTVLVDDVTRRASEAAIAYEDAGRARGQGARAARARLDGAARRGRRRRRSAAAPGSRRRSSAANAELEHVITAFEESARAAAARAWSTVVGEAGSGKSGCCGSSSSTSTGSSRVGALAPGALPVLRRGRRLLGAGGDGPGPGRDRRGGGAGLGAREADRRPSSSTCPTSASAGWSSRGSLTCSGSSSAPPPTAPTYSAGGGCSSSGCPTRRPVVLVFEDLQWADSGLLEFIDYLLEWSADRPLFVLALGRPELLDGAARRGRPRRSSSAPLPDAAMRAAARGARAGPARGPGRPDSVAGPRGCRCTRWRRCGCCSTAGCSPGREAVTRDRRHRGARRARDPARARRRAPGRAERRASGR